MVKGDNEAEVFAKPGDSGSLVFIKHEGLNIVVGMVLCSWQQGQRNALHFGERCVVIL